jgi:hypothetical protein
VWSRLAGEQMGGNEGADNKKASVYVATTASIRELWYVALPVDTQEGLKAQKWLISTVSELTSWIEWPKIRDLLNAFLLIVFDGGWMWGEIMTFFSVGLIVSSDISQIANCLIEIQNLFLAF